MARPRTGKARQAANERTHDLLERRAARAEKMATSSTVTVTLRIPSAFNEWLDAYRHLSYPERVGKQELVVEGLRMAYLRRGMPGETILGSEPVARGAPSRT